MKIFSVIAVIVFGAALAFSINCFAEDDVCPAKSICKECKEKCRINPTQCPEDCNKCRGCLGKYEQ